MILCMLYLKFLAKFLILMKLKNKTSTIMQKFIIVTKITVSNRFN